MGSHLKCVPIAHVLTVGSFDSGTFCLVECFVLSRTFCLLGFLSLDLVVRRPVKGSFVVGRFVILYYLVV